MNALRFKDDRLLGGLEWVAQRGERLLTNPGRELLDRYAPYNYRLHLTRLDVTFWKHGSQVCEVLPAVGDYPRTPHTVGIAINTFLFARSSHSNSGWLWLWQLLETNNLLAHWGVYIRDDFNQEPEKPISVFGMNYDHAMQELVLEKAWGTIHGFSSQILEQDINKFEENRYRDITVYCSSVEFVLTAQLLLGYFTVTAATSLQNPEDRHLTAVSYNLLTKNCQHFAKILIEYMLQENWTDSTRLEKTFTLGDISSKALSWQEDWEWQAVSLCKANPGLRKYDCPDTRTKRFANSRPDNRWNCPQAPEMLFYTLPHTGFAAWANYLPDGPDFFMQRHLAPCGYPFVRHLHSTDLVVLRAIIPMVLYYVPLWLANKHYRRNMPTAPGRRLAAVVIVGYIIVQCLYSDVMVIVKIWLGVILVLLPLGSPHVVEVSKILLEWMALLLVPFVVFLYVVYRIISFFI